MKHRIILAAGLCALMVMGGCKRQTVVETLTLPIIEKALGDTRSVFYQDFSKYPQDMKDLPIGIFDSGTGGLTVAERIISFDRFNNISGAQGSDRILDFAGEHFVYLADQANMPYGTYDANGKADYLQELVVKDALFLLGDRYYKSAFDLQPTGEKPRCKIIVIACNTATAYGLSYVRSLLERSGTGVKVIGVINAGSKAALDLLSDKEHPCTIGVLATVGTISSGAYERTINEMAAERNGGPQITVVNQSGYGFAESVDSEPDFVNPALTGPRESYRGPRIGTGDGDLKAELLDVYNFDYEEGRMLWSEGEDGAKENLQLNSAINYARFNLVSLVERHRLSGSTIPISAVILGCTHYPFQLETLQKVVAELREYNVEGKYPYRELLAPDLIFIDPAVYTAEECYRTLREDGNLAFRVTPQEVKAYISVPSAELDPKYLTDDGKLTYEFKYGRATGTEEITTRQVPFSKSNLDAENLERIHKMLPYCYSLIYPTLN